MSAKGLEAAIRLLQKDNDFVNEVKEQGGRASLLHGFNLTAVEKRRVVEGIKSGWNPKKQDLPSRITKGAGGIRGFFG